MGGREITIDTFTRQAGNNSQVYSRVRLSSVDLPLELLLKAEGMGTNLWKMVAGSDEVLGDELFDNQVLARGEEAEVTAKLNEVTRGVILDMVSQKVKFENGEFYFERLGYFKSIAEIDKVVALMQSTADQLQDTDIPQEQRLADNVTNDSDPEVRARNLAMLWLHHEESDALLKAMSVAGSDMRPGLPLSADETQKQLALLAAASERVGVDKQLAAAIALGKWGTAEVVPNLRAWASEQRNDLDFLKRTAQQSVGNIQARVGDITSGSLSMTEVAAGSLSETEGQGGELSVAMEESLRMKKAAAASRIKQE
jgi:hypothetical protein